MIKRTYAVVLLSFSIFFTTSVLAAKHSSLFSEFTIDSPLTLTHNVMIADVSSIPGKELITLGVDKDNQSWLIIYKQMINRQGFEVLDQMMLDKSISRFDISEYKDGHQQKIFFMSHNQAMVYQPPSGANKGNIKMLGNIQSLFLNENPQFIVESDFLIELDDSGNSHIISHHFTGVNIYGLDGNFSQQTQLNIKPQIAMENDAVEFTKRKLWVFDVNFDNKQDVITVGDGELIVHAQNDESNEFSIHKIKLNDSISGVNWWDKRDASGNSLDQTNLVYRSLEEIRDVNGDGIIDLIVKYTQSSGVLDRANNFEVFFGKNRNGKLIFDDKANTVVTGEGTLTGLRLLDINNDNKLEVVLSGFDIGISQIIGALMSGSIDQDVYLYQLDNQLTFSEDADVEKEVELNFSIASGQSGNPVVELLDINGDGLKDFLLSSGKKTLKVYLGQNGKRLFNKRSQRYKTQLPKDGNAFEVNDINYDGKDDIIFKYGRLDGDEKRKQFKVLISKY